MAETKNKRVKSKFLCPVPVVSRSDCTLEPVTSSFPVASEVALSYPLSVQCSRVKRIQFPAEKASHRMFAVIRV